MIEAEMWEELKGRMEFWKGVGKPITPEVVFSDMEFIERVHLSERVAEILRKADYSKVDQWHSSLYSTCIVGSWIDTLIPAIAKALETGNTTEIEKWVKQ